MHESITLFASMSIPAQAIEYTLFTLSFDKKTSAQKISIWRYIYGYAQTVNKKRYEHEGLVAHLGGKKIEKGCVLIPHQNSERFIAFLQEHDIAHTTRTLWGDAQ